MASRSQGSPARPLEQSSGRWLLPACLLPRLREAMEALDFKRICDETDLDKIPLLGRGLSVLFEHGVYEGDYFRDLIADHLADLGVQTFADLRFDDPDNGTFESQQYKLLVTASDVTRGRLMRLPWDYALHGIDPSTQHVADAVRASMSIPFFFRPVILPVPGAAPSTLIDGGLLSNFPVDAFDRLDGRRPRWPTIGIKLFAASQIERGRARGDRHHESGDGDHRHYVELARPDAP